ncbi:MAG TPA: response regulator [Wenzhouxiangella sp.]|nr:response regulator [Wenzhouxiangella sp.]
MATKVLLADNEPNLLVSLEYLLQRQRYEVLTCQDGNQALELIEREMPAIVIADVLLPGQSGFEICQHLKSSETFAGTPTLLLSAQARETDAAKARALGADAFLIKPFSISELLDQIEDLLGPTQ